MIVPYPAGGTTDFLGRQVVGQLGIGLGATVIVENKPGVAAALGAAGGKGGAGWRYAVTGNLDHAGHQ
jgi:tripartite-type tricarboxylate transporter receptor subunit TctC